MHGTHERSGIYRSEKLTKSAADAGFRAFDIYNVAQFAHDISKTNLNRAELWFQIKDRAIADGDSGDNKSRGMEYFNACASLLDTDYIYRS